MTTSRTKNKMSAATFQSDSDRVFISVRGELYETSKSTLDRFPDTFLARKANQMTQAQTLAQRNKILLYCRAEAFDAILFYYQSNGILSRPCHLSPEEFVRECYRFELDEGAINKVRELEGLPVDEKNLGLPFKYKTQEILYKLLESDAGIGSIIYSVTSSLLVLASIILACAVTMPSIRATRSAIVSTQDPYFLTELILNVVFCIEYTCRFIVSPKKLEFVASALNVIDLVAFLPFFVILAIDSSKLHEMTSLKVARIVRIGRIIRLASRNNTMATVVNILHNCLLDILTMCMYILLTSVFWASMAFYAEMAETNTLFQSIPDSMWWSVQTVLTIGYGDIIPNTIIGKLIGSGVTVLAAFTLTVPLLSLGGKMLNLYSQKFHIQIGPDLIPEDRENPVSTACT